VRGAACHALTTRESVERRWRYPWRGAAR